LGRYSVVFKYVFFSDNYGLFAAFLATAVADGHFL